MLVRLNGKSVLSCSVTRPILGAWHASLDLDALPAAGAAALDVGDDRLTGTVVRSGDYAGHVRARVVGGNGGLAKVLTARAYRASSFRVVVQDTLTAAGERLSETSDAALLATKLPAWVRIEGTCAAALTQLVRFVAGAVWRVLPSGAIWFGIPSYPAVKLDDETLDDDPVARRLLLVADDIALDAGVTLAGKKISHVRTTILPESTRTEAYYL